MNTQQANFEKICDSPVAIYSPIEDNSGHVFVTALNGDIYKVEESQLELKFTTSGQPTAVVFDSQGSAFIADPVHQAILGQSEGETKEEITPIIKDYEGIPLKGPHSLAYSPQTNMLYFSDSGQIGETNLSNTKGSLFVVDLELNVLKSILHECLASPQGLCLSKDESKIYLCETCNNRILRLLQNPGGVYHCSSFYQFSGRFGPTAIAMHNSGALFIARFDFNNCAKDGLISVINENGELLMELTVPGCPEITGLSFSKSNPNILYMTENTNNSLLKILVSIK